MNFEQLDMSEAKHQKLFETLKAQGLTENQINNILNNKFSVFKENKDLDLVFGENNNYQEILQYLSDGYTIDELENKVIKTKDIENFKEMLSKQNLTIENAKAINQYSNGSKMILAVKRKIASYGEIKEGIINDLKSKLSERNLDEEYINKIPNIIEKLDYEKPLYQNYDISNNLMSENNIPNNCFPSINMAIKHLNSLEHIEETIKKLDDGLSKARISEPIKLYRAVKLQPNESLEEVSSKLGDNKGYTSTSPIYETSFAKYDEYDTVMELYVPQGTKGIYISSFSDYDSAEQEVLLDSNDIIFMDIQSSVIDKNGKTKNILKGIVLSKDRECYKELDKTNFKQSDEKQTNVNELPVKQNVFSKFFNNLKAKFSKRQNKKIFSKEQQEGNQAKQTNTSYIDSLKEHNQLENIEATIVESKVKTEQEIEIR